MKIFKSILFILFILTNASCKKDSLDASKLNYNGSQQGNPAIDAWLKANYLDPFNIEVLYKWDASELNTNNTLVPPDEKHVIPVMEMIKKSWIDVYNAMGNPNFIKEHSPKQYMLVGSPEYNSSGGLTTGYAEGGTKIVLFRINWFDLGNRPLMKRILKTIHHEYVHILNQKKRFQDEFAVVSLSEYTSTFAQLNDAQARELGFLSPYSASGPSEDFAEMVSIILTEGKEGYEDILASISNQNAVAKIRAKEAIISDYYKTYWNIDFNELIAKTEASFNELSPIELNQYMGTKYNNIHFDVRSPGLFGPAAALAINSTQQAFRNHTSGAASGRSIDYITLNFSNANLKTAEIQFRYSLINATGNAAGKVALKVDYDGSTNKLKFSNPTAGLNAAFVMTQLEPFFQYLTSRTFKLKFKESYDKDTQGDNYGGLVEVNNPDEFAYGTLTAPTFLRSLGIQEQYLNLQIHDERFWGGAALNAIRKIKTNFIVKDANKRVDVIRFFMGINDAKMHAKLSTMPELRTYTNVDNTFTINFDPIENKLKFSNHQVVGTNNINHRAFADEWNNYLSSREFKVESYSATGFGNSGDKFVKISNIVDETDFFICQLNEIELHKEIGRSVHYFNLDKKDLSYYYGEPLTALKNFNPSIGTVSYTFSHLNLRLLENNTAKIGIYFLPSNSTTLTSGIIDLNTHFDRDKNEFRFSMPTSTLNPNLMAGLQNFLTYLTTKTFKAVYSKGNFYSPSGVEGSLIDINNPANYIILPY
jgi:substrate import-associated zinc metallohydrolase lipoprotein